MGYVSAAGFSRGLRSGIAISEQRRRRRQDEREESRYQESLERAKANKAESDSRMAAAREAEDVRFSELQAGEQQRLKEAAAQGAQGPMGLDYGKLAQGVGEMGQSQQRFEQIRGIAQRMDPRDAQRFVAETRGQLVEEARQRSSHELVDHIQDRMAIGGYNAYGDSEPSEDTLARVKLLTEYLDQPGADPLQAMEIERSISTAVQTENKKRMERERTGKFIEDTRRKLGASGDTTKAALFEQLQAAHDAGEMSHDDVVDRSFEITNGRKTARSAGPTAYEVRQDVLRQLAGDGIYDPTPDQILEMERRVNPDILKAENEYMRKEAMERNAMKARLDDQRPKAQKGGPLPPNFQEMDRSEKRKVIGALRAGHTAEDVLRIADEMGLDYDTIPDATLEDLAGGGG